MFDAISSNWLEKIHRQMQNKILKERLKNGVKRYQIC
jgi:hypothetical protein